MSRPERQVFERVLIARRRLIPLEGDVLVKKGDLVEPADLIAKAETVPGDPYVVDLIAELGVRMGPEQVAKVMLKRVGDRVEAKEPIARLSVGVFGDVHEACSPVAGVIEFISHAYARVLVREDVQKAAAVVIVNVARKLDISPMLLRAYMRCREGDEVRQGAIIADSAGGMGIDYCYAPATGTIEKVCTKTGTVTIVRPSKPTMVDAYLKGRVTLIHAERGATVQTVASFVQGVFGIGFENHGSLQVTVNDPSGLLDEEDVLPEHSGAVLLGGARVTLGALRKAVDTGVRGIITGGADHSDLSALLGRDIGVGITGQEDLALTVVLTEGFGEMPMAKDTWALLRAAGGRLVSLNGSTQVRAGVLRPEVVIPCDGEDGGEARPVEERLRESEQLRGEASVGSRVRVVRNPRFGAWGRVVGLPADLVRFETEARLAAAEVQLEDGSRLMVPLANLEVF